MAATKKAAKSSPEELQALLAAMMEQGHKDGMIRASDPNAHLEKMDLSPEQRKAYAAMPEEARQRLIRRTYEHGCGIQPTDKSQSHAADHHERV